MKTKRIRAIIFDLDGTLIDTILLHGESFTRLFGQLGKKLSEKEIRPLLRHNTEKIYHALAARKHLGIGMEKFLDLRRKTYYSLLRGKKTVFSDVFPALRRLRGYKLGIATNSSRLTLDRSTTRNLRNRFDATITFSDVLRAKPDPEMLQIISRKLRVKPCECAFVGDSVMDIRAARNAGMYAIALYRKTGASRLSELRREKPDALLRTLDELPALNAVTQIATDR